MGERRFLTKNRFVSFLLAIAMVLTLLPIGAVQAKAEEATVKLYFELPQGTKVTDWGVNVWSNAKVTEGNLDQTIAPWGSDKLPTLLPDSANDKWGYVKISGTIEGLQFVKEDKTDAGMLKLQRKDMKKHILTLQRENGIQVLKKQ